MNPLIGQGLISAGGGLLGSVVNGILGVWQANKDREFNAEQASLNRSFQRDERLAAQEFDLNMWNLNNEYNDIGSQLARARAAGVNPAALIGGDYKSATSSPVTSTPGTGSAASSSAGGAVGSAFINQSASLANAAINGVKALADARSTNELLAYTKAEIESRVYNNLAEIQHWAHDNGLKDANREMILKTTAWMDGMNEAQIRLAISQEVKNYNESYAIFRKIYRDDALANQEIAESNSRIGVNEVTKEKIGIEADMFENDMQYHDSLNQAQLTQEEERAYIAQKRMEFADQYNVLLGSQEFEFLWHMHVTGKLPAYFQKVIAEGEQATWKPADYKQTYNDGLKVGGVQLFDKEKTEYSFPSSYANPTYNQFNKGVAPVGFHGAGVYF